MSPIHTRLERSYYIRQAVVCVLMGGFGLIILQFGIANRYWLGIVAGVAPIGIWLFIMLSEYLRGAKILDTEGVTRRDGKRFAWTALKESKYVRARLQSGELGALNHVELHFPGGQVRIFPLILENAGEVLRFVEDLLKEREKNSKALASLPQ